MHFTYQTQLPCKGLWHMPTSGACYLDLYAFDIKVLSPCSTSAPRHVVTLVRNQGLSQLNEDNMR